MDIGIFATAIAVVIIWLQKTNLIQPAGIWVLKFLCRLNPVAYYQRLLLKIADRESLLRKRVEILEDYSQTPIIITDSVGKLIWANQAYCKLVGVPMERTLGFNWSNVIFQDDREAVVKGWQEAIANESDWVYKFRIWSFAQSRVVWVLARCFVARNKINKKPAGWIATLIRIEQPKEEEECPFSHFTPPIKE